MTLTHCQIYNILKAHESEYTEENSKLNFGGPSTLVSKTTRKEVCSDSEADENKEDVLMISDEEVVAYYSYNKVKKFYKKPIGGNINNKSVKIYLLSSSVYQKSVGR